MNLLREFALLALVVATGATYSLFSGLAPAPWSTPELAPGEIRLADALPLDPLWIDARSEAEFASAHIPGAIRMDEGDWDGGLLRLMQVWTPGRTIVVYCASLDCGTSKRIAEALDQALGGVEIYSLHGGWEAWPE